MINTRDETRNHLRNPQGHESQNTLIDSPMETKGHTYTDVRNESSGGIRDRYSD